jgi:hypothetical protein
VLFASFVNTKHEEKNKEHEERNKNETRVIENLELIMANKLIFTLRRFLWFNCGLLGKVFGTLAMYSRTIVLLVYNTLRKKECLV